MDSYAPRRLLVILYLILLANAAPHYRFTDWPSDDRDVIDYDRSPSDWQFDYDTEMDWTRDVNKRSPACIRKCVEQGSLHPIQCHSLC